MKEARRAARLSQSSLAAEVGCKQSALSMFEQGDGTKLNDDVVGKILKKFGIEISKGGEKHPDIGVVESLPPGGEPGTAFCPNPSCPSHVRYRVDGKILLRPDRKTQDPAGGRFCAICGEALQRSCPNCAAPVHDGGICSLCGNPYITLAGHL